VSDKPYIYKRASYLKPSLHLAVTVCVSHSRRCRRRRVFNNQSQGILQAEVLGGVGGAVSPNVPHPEVTRHRAAVNKSIRDVESHKLLVQMPKSSNFCPEFYPIPSFRRLRSCAFSRLCGPSPRRAPHSHSPILKRSSSGFRSVPGLRYGLEGVAR
jgi:hypothetical protein